MNAKELEIYSLENINCLIPIGKSPCSPRGVSTPAWRQLGQEALFLWAIAATVTVLFLKCVIQLDFVPLFTASWSGQTPSQKHRIPHSLQSLLKLWHSDLNLAHLATSTRLKELCLCKRHRVCLSSQRIQDFIYLSYLAIRCCASSHITGHLFYPLHACSAKLYWNGFTIATMLTSKYHPHSLSASWYEEWITSFLLRLLNQLSFALSG